MRSPAFPVAWTWASRASSSIGLCFIVSLLPPRSSPRRPCWMGQLLPAWQEARTAKLAPPGCRHQNGRDTHAPAAPFYAWALAGRACRSLRRGLDARRVLVLVGLLALLPLDLLLQRAQRLVGGAAHGAHQRGAVLEHGVRVLAGEALLQAQERGRAAQAAARMREGRGGCP